MTQATNDVEQLEPMLASLARTATAAGIRRKPRSLVADAGYWRAENVDGSIPGTPELFIPVAKHGRRGRIRKDGGRSQSKTDHPRHRDERAPGDTPWTATHAASADHGGAGLRADQRRPGGATIHAAGP